MCGYFKRFNGIRENVLNFHIEIENCKTFKIWYHILNAIIEKNKIITIFFK